MKEYLIIDRIESEFAVCEKDNLSILQIPLPAFDFLPAEGDCIYFDGMWKKDINKTAQQAARISQMIEELFE